MKLKIIAEEGVIVANPGVVQSKLSAMMGKASQEEIDYKRIGRYKDKMARFINDPNGDIIYIADTEEELQQIKIPPSTEGDEIMSVRDLIKRLDPQTFQDDTPPKIFVLKPAVKQKAPTP